LLGDKYNSSLKIQLKVKEKKNKAENLGEFHKRTSQLKFSALKKSEKGLFGGEK